MSEEGWPTFVVAATYKSIAIAHGSPGTAWDPIPHRAESRKGRSSRFAYPAVETRATPRLPGHPPRPEGHRSARNTSWMPGVSALDGGRAGGEDVPGSSRRRHPPTQPDNGMASPCRSPGSREGATGPAPNGGLRRVTPHFRRRRRPARDTTGSHVRSTRRCNRQAPPRA